MENQTVTYLIGLELETQSSTGFWGQAQLDPSHRQAWAQALTRQARGSTPGNLKVGKEKKEFNPHGVARALPVFLAFRNPQSYFRLPPGKLISSHQVSIQSLQIPPTHTLPQPLTPTDLSLPTGPGGSER